MKSPSWLNAPNTIMWIGCFIFITISISTEDWTSQVHHQAEIFGWRGCLNLLKSYASLSSFLTFMVCDTFLSCIRNTECLHALPQTRKDTSMSLAMKLNNLLGSLIIMAWISRNLRVLFLSERISVKVRSCHTFVTPLGASNSFRILCTVLRLLQNTVESL